MVDPAAAPVPLRSLDDHRLLVATFSAFHTLALMVLLTAYLHRGGDLGDALGSLGSVAGSGLFLALWATTTWTTRRAVAQLDPAVMGDWTAGRAMARGLEWGSVNGVQFLLAALVLFTVRYVMEHGIGVGVGVAAALGLYGVIAMLVAAIVGGAIGFFTAMVDWLAVWIAVRLVRWMRLGSPIETPQPDAMPAQVPDSAA